MTVRARSSFVVALVCAALGAACSGERGDSGASAGSACSSGAECGQDDWMCFAAGTASSCSGGGLCVGTAEKLTCAFGCDSDADCGSQGAASVCLVDCVERILNGYCVEPAVRDELLTYPFCSEPGDPSSGIAGSSSGSAPPAAG